MEQVAPALRACRNVWCPKPREQARDRSPDAAPPRPLPKVCGASTNAMSAPLRVRARMGRHSWAKPDMEALNWTRESIRRPGCRSITIRRRISRSIRACKTRPCRTAPRNFAHRMRRQQLLVGTKPKDAAPLHFVAADVHRKRSGIGPFLWNLLESRPLLIAKPNQGRHVRWPAILLTR
jgi:hypothetical protein